MKSRGGFTVVEVMIVLAVTGLIFVSAILLVGGRTSQVEFTTAAQALQSQIQQTINDVTNGFYPNSGTLFKCDGSSGSLIISTVSPNQQGSNSGCIFVGKALQFINGSAQYTTYAIAGLQDSGGQEVQKYADAKPLVLAHGSSAPGNSVPAALTGSVAFLENGINVIKMFYCSSVSAANCSISNNDSGTIGAVAFLSSLGSYNTSNGQLLSGSQHLNLIPIASSVLSFGPNPVDNIDSSLDSNGVGGADYFNSPGTTTNTVGICFTSGTTRQSGLIIIGGSNASQLAVKLTIYSTTNCT